MQRALILLIFIGAIASAFGQGRVSFFNTASTLVTTNSMPGGPASGSLSPVGGIYCFALFYAPTGTTDSTLFTFTGGYATNTAAAGQLFGPVTEVLGALGNTRLAFLVRGWSANIGTDFSAVQTYLANPTFTGWYGESPIGSQTPALPEGPYPNVFAGADRITGFNLNMIPAVPEPLAVLGGAALFFFGRRRARH